MGHRLNNRMFVWGRGLGDPTVPPHPKPPKLVEFLQIARQSVAEVVTLGVQSTFGARHFWPKIYVWKINKMPEFYMIFASKKYFPDFWGTAPLCPRLLRLWPRYKTCPTVDTSFEMCFAVHLTCIRYGLSQRCSALCCHVSHRPYSAPYLSERIQQTAFLCGGAVAGRRDPSTRQCICLPKSDT